MQLLGRFAIGSVRSARNPVELRFIWYDDGEESTVIREQLDRFEAENPDIKVVMDIVAYKTILEQVPIQVEAGKGPDIMRTTNVAVMTCNYLDLRPLLKDPQYFEDNFPPASLQVFRCGDDTEALHGFPMQFTVTGPYINRTLFEQAGIEVPSDVKENVTWEEWTEVTKKVAEATETWESKVSTAGSFWFSINLMIVAGITFDIAGSRRTSWFPLARLPSASCSPLVFFCANHFSFK